MKPLQGNRLKSAVLWEQSACGTEDLWWSQRKRLAAGTETTRGVLAVGAGQYRFAARERSCRKVTSACGGVIACDLRRAADRGVEARAFQAGPNLGAGRRVGGLHAVPLHSLPVYGVKHKRATDTGEMASTDPS